MAYHHGLHDRTGGFGFAAFVGLLAATPSARLIRALGRCVRSDFGVLRFEIERLWRARSQSHRVRKYLETHTVRCLHIGAGTTPLRGWLNTDLVPQSEDVVYLDVAERLPFSDNELDFIFHEHMIHQISHEAAASLLDECFRVLKPNGRMRVATPDLQFLVDIYLGSTHTETQQRFVRRTLDLAFPRTGFYHGGFVMNHFMRGWDHQFIYDEATLSQTLQRAGFSNIRRWPVGVSDEPALQNIETHGHVISQEFNLLQTMVLEADKSVTP
jgi:predicted SAM-dependent methyltransferase